MCTKKRLLSFFVALTLLTCTYCNVYAAADPTNCKDSATASYFESYQNTDQIASRLKYFSTVFSSIAPKSGKIICQGDYTSLANGIDITLVVALEKSTSSGWNQVKSWSRIFSPGRGGNIVSGTYTSPASGNYRTLTTAFAINSKGTIVESVKVYSQTIKY